MAIEEWKLKKETGELDKELEEEERKEREEEDKRREEIAKVLICYNPHWINKPLLLLVMVKIT